MKIELSSQNLLKISWPQHDDATDIEIRKRLSTVPDIEVGRGRCCWCPAIQLWRLTELFPKASFDYAAMQECDRIARLFWESMVSMGVVFRIDPMGTVYVASEGNSPVLAQLVAERSHALKPFVEEAMKHAIPATVVIAQPQSIQGPLLPDDVALESWVKGAQEFAAREREKVQYPRRKRSKPKKSQVS